MNTVRKHLSVIKGGHLALAAQSARIVTLVISDVPGDDPAAIASGPTVPDASTLAETNDIIHGYNIWTIAGDGDGIDGKRAPSSKPMTATASLTRWATLSERAKRSPT